MNTDLLERGRERERGTEGGREGWREREREGERENTNSELLERRERRKTLTQTARDRHRGVFMERWWVSGRRSEALIVHGCKG